MVAACAPCSSRPQWHSFAAYFERPPRVILVVFSGVGVGRRSHTGVRASSDDWCAAQAARGLTGALTCAVW